jgi:hypothetical protein
MSSLGVHTVQSVVAGAALYPFIGENVVPFGLAAIFIDLDHVIEYIRQTRSLDVRGVFAYSKLIEDNLDKRFLVWNMFHLLREDYFFIRAFSLFEYMYRSRTGRYVLSVRDLVEKHEPDISGIPGVRSWLQKWGWKQDGVIDAKPDFFEEESKRKKK